MKWNLQMPKRSLLIISALAIVAIGAYLSSSKPAEFTSYINIPIAEKHRGVCWVGGSQQIDSIDINRVASLGVNWISQTPFGWQSGHDNPSISGMHQTGERGWWGERDEGLITTTELARAKGIKTILKPHIWLRDEGGKWRGEIAMKTEEDWQKWFSDYEQFILHYAKLAEAAKMEMLCIGTELHQTCVQREADWRALIKKIRAVYSGQLTYAANFADEYEEVSFWDELDFIGIQAYFPITDSHEPKIEDLNKSWDNHLSTLEKFSNKYKKPVLFTEIGYKSTKNAGITPWEWPQHVNMQERKALYSEENQAVLYESMMQKVMTAPFIAGIHIWKWFPKYEARQARARQRNENYIDIDFTPQGKTAEEVMGKWFRKFQ
ncbi:glycoside hydrolase family 113 [Roseivirga pacifica]|uniref:glycoside hydrolase family 113 n=1 Tax=Roseivirga pacifica TaxID=1267423 RepID=UPI00227AD073|nr:hypothetical protein [Roseivirga pacifica]